MRRKSNIVLILIALGAFSAVPSLNAQEQDGLPLKQQPISQENDSLASSEEFSINDKDIPNSNISISISEDRLRSVPVDVPIPLAKSSSINQEGKSTIVKGEDKPEVSFNIFYYLFYKFRAKESVED